MKFPNIEVQPHWLEALEAAAVVMPNCRWLCHAVALGNEPKTEQEIRTAVMQAIAPFNTVDSWIVREMGVDLATRTEEKEYRVAWLNHMIEQCLEMQQALHEEEDEEEDDSEYDCPNCGGTGEGQYDGQTCSVCRGKGVCPK